MIYEPAEDTLLIRRHIQEYIKSKNKKVLDMSSGSCILAEEAKKYSKNVLAADINPESGRYAKKLKIKFICSDLFQKIKGGFDLILFNPPYLPDDKLEDKESKRITTGGKNGFEIIERFLKDVKKHLNKKGVVLLVCSTLTGDVETLFKKYGFEFKKIDEEKAFFERILLYELK